ncbi:hypothetical protein [Streptomyces lunaelactis]|uniref:hypothetical protein n=1 Tax=Streptomyces lunaelactis TaxID=1535768 RepID=UPI001584D085|nr:hypothetical protein [Streptomyces lunaelactis]NUK15668.1 hypothetical protein [Streptomyces lunaelactis]
MTLPNLEACCFLLTLLPGLPSASAAVAYQRARYNQPYASFRTDGQAMLPEPWAPVPGGDREARDAT